MHIVFGVERYEITMCITLIPGVGRGSKKPILIMGKYQ